MQPPGYPAPPPAAAAKDNTTLWGVLGIVLALCCPFLGPVLGVVFGVLSMNEAKKHGKQPTLAYVAFGLVGLSVLWTIFSLSTGFYGNMFN